MSPYSERFLFAQLFHFLSDPVFVINEKFKILVCNDACVETYGYTKEKFVALNPEQIIHPDYYDAFRKTLEKTLLSATKLEESVHIRKDGSSFPVEVHSRAEVYGDETGLIVVVRDITERKKAEEDIENIFNLSPDMIGVFTTEGALLKVNPSWERVLGYTQKELLDMGWADLVHPDDVEKTNKKVKNQLSGNSVVGFINRYRHKDGSYRILEWQATFATDGIVHATARDITIRKQLEEAIRISEVDLQYVLKLAQIGRWQWDRKTDVGIWSEQIYEMLGFEKDEVDITFEWLLKQMHSDDRERVRREIERAVNEQTSIDMEYRIFRKDGSECTFHSIGQVRIDESGETVGMTGVIQDVSRYQEADEV